jgi:uncharacterized protein (UPF0216 family)
VFGSEGEVRKLLESMNRHVPARRPSLRQLLEMEEPHYVGKDGNKYLIRREELELIASLLDPWDSDRIKLPIVVMTDASEGGMWKVLGKLEVAVVSQIVGRKPEFEDRMRLFHPHVVELHNKLPTATTTMFSP